MIRDILTDEFPANFNSSVQIPLTDIQSFIYCIITCCYSFLLIFVHFYSKRIVHFLPSNLFVYESLILEIFLFKSNIKGPRLDIVCIPLHFCFFPPLLRLHIGHHCLPGHDLLKNLNDGENALVRPVSVCAIYHLDAAN